MNLFSGRGSTDGGRRREEGQGRFGDRRQRVVLRRLRKCKIIRQSLSHITV